MTGKVTDQDGKPVASGLITFVVGSDSLSGPIANDGSFSVAGIPVGTAKVTVSSPEPIDKAAQMGGGSTPLKDGPKEQIERMKELRNRQEEARKKWFPVDNKYSSVKDTPLTCEVTGGEKSQDFKVDRAPPSD